MTKSYKRDIQILMKMFQNQTKIANAIKRFGCNQNNLDKDDMAFDLCAFYMAQIGEEAKLLTDDSKAALTCINTDILKSFRNMIDRTYEKVSKVYLKAFIFSTIEPQAMEEVKSKIKYCTENTS